MSRTDSTVFVLVSDRPYFEKAQSTIIGLRTFGRWTGDIVYITINFDLDKDELSGLNVIEKKFEQIDVSHVLSKIGPDGFSNSDKREIHKTTQYQKLLVFSDYFRKWQRVVYVDANIRCCDSVFPLLELDYKGKFLCPDEYYKEENILNNKLGNQISKDDPVLYQQLLDEYGTELIDSRDFLNCMWIFCTSLCDIVTEDGLTTLQLFQREISRWPLLKCNEMTIMCLLLHVKYKLWEPFPYKIGSKYLFDWSEANRPGTTWRDYYFIKYSCT